jgi:hypothetical protein
MNGGVHGSSSTDETSQGCLDKALKLAKEDVQDFHAHF